jgi:hypothetical protein
LPIIEELGLPAFYIYKCCMASIPITGRCKKFHLCVTCLGFGLPFTVPWVNWVLVGPGNSPMAVLLGYKRGGGFLWLWGGFPASETLFVVTSKISVVKLKFEIRIQENCLILEYQVQVFKLYIICSIQGAS